jgi:hypothetical protein
LRRVSTDSTGWYLDADTPSLKDFEVRAQTYAKRLERFASRCATNVVMGLMSPAAVVLFVFNPIMLVLIVLLLIAALSGRVWAGRDDGWYTTLPFAQSPGREEKRIPLTVFLATFGIVLRWVKVFPHAHGVDVFVLLVPPTVHHFEQCRVAVEAFQVGVWDCGGLVFELVGGEEAAFGLWGRW